MTDDTTPPTPTNPHHFSTALKKKTNCISSTPYDRCPHMIPVPSQCLYPCYATYVFAEMGREERKKYHPLSCIAHPHSTSSLASSIVGDFCSPPKRLTLPLGFLLKIKGVILSSCGVNLGEADRVLIPGADEGGTRSHRYSSF